MRISDWSSDVCSSDLFSFSPAAHIMNPALVVADRLLPYRLPRYKGVDIDEPEDLELAEMIYRGWHAMRKAAEERQRSTSETPGQSRTSATQVDCRATFRPTTRCEASAHAPPSHTGERREG